MHAVADSLYANCSVRHLFNLWKKKPDGRVYDDLWKKRKGLRNEGNVTKTRGNGQEGYNDKK